MTVDEIYKNEKISVRSYNVCKRNKLNTIEDIQQYFYEHKSFNKLQNCGRRTSEELRAICINPQQFYYKILVEDQEESKEGKYDDLNVRCKNDSIKEKSIVSIVTELTRVQREVVNSFIYVNTNNLSIRSKNAISQHLNGNLKIKNFTEKILYTEYFKVKGLKNIGLKCIPELEKYISVIKSFLIEVSETTNQSHLISLKNTFLIQRTYSISKIPEKILESESIFLLTNFLLDKNALFDQNQTIIAKKSLKIYFNQTELTLDDVALEVGLTRERVRQIRKICLDELPSKLHFIQNFNDDLFQKYGIDSHSDQIEIDSDLVERINSTNDINLSREFITLILYSYLNSNFSLIGNMEDVLQPKYFNARKRHNWLNFYLIKNEICSEINFNALTEDIGNRLSERIIDTYSFNFRSYLSKFLNNYSIESLDMAVLICEKIVNEEFNLYLDLRENIIFKRNTIKQAYEYAFEALETLGKPSKVREIYRQVKSLNPDYDTDEAKIRVSMKRKNGFVPIGRTSVFGLKKWEKELDDFKGGTIREIVEDYLNGFTEPKHISLITANVLKYRPKSNQSSILQNLRLEESGLYVFFKGSNIGLSTIKYKDQFEKSSGNQSGTILTWAESLTEFREFISKENRLPSHSGSLESEKKLYRWFNVQKNKINKGKLSKEKTKLINEIEGNNYQTIGNRGTYLELKYLELISFIQKETRLPSAGKQDEKTLYSFFYKQRKLFKDDNLDINEQTKFLEVARLIQKIKYEN